MGEGRGALPARESLGMVGCTYVIAGDWNVSGGNLCGMLDRYRWPCRPARRVAGRSTVSGGQLGTAWLGRMVRMGLGLGAAAAARPSSGTIGRLTGNKD